MGSPRLNLASSVRSVTRFGLGELGPPYTVSSGRLENPRPVGTTHAAGAALLGGTPGGASAGSWRAARDSARAARRIGRSAGCGLRRNRTARRRCHAPQQRCAQTPRYEGRRRAAALALTSLALPRPCGACSPLPPRAAGRARATAAQGRDFRSLVRRPSHEAGAAVAVASPRAWARPPPFPRAARGPRGRRAAAHDAAAAATAAAGLAACLGRLAAPLRPSVRPST